MVRFDDNIILAIGAHGDDIEYGCGGFLSGFNETYGIIVAHDNDERMDECIKSANVLDYQPIFLSLSDRSIEKLELIDKLEKNIDEIKPNIILVHSINDTHQDHKTVTEALLSSARGYCGTILFYKSPSTHTFNPTLHFGLLNDVFELKLEAIKKHKTQSNRIYLSEDSIKASFGFYPTTYRQSGYAESFELFRMVL